jgi:hypothetical protein
MPKVTDPALLSTLNSGRVTDPNTAGALNRPRGPMDVALGAVTTFNRNFLPFTDEAADALQAVSNLAQGRAQSLPQAWQQARTQSGDYASNFAIQNPRAAALTRGVGMAGSAAVPGGVGAKAFAAPVQIGARVLPQLPVNVARGGVLAAGQAGLYAGAGEGTAGERINAASNAATNPLTVGLGMAAGALATPRQIPPPPKATPRQTLKEIGVQPSPLPLPKRTESKMQRMPIVGNAVAGMRERQVEQFNRGVGLKALEPIGESIPANIRPGADMVRYVENKISSVYDEATRLVPSVTIDQPFISDLGQIAARKVDLAEPEAKLFDKIIRDRLNRLSAGTASGDTVKQIHSELGRLQGEQAAKNNSTLAEMLGDVRASLMGVVGRTDPRAGELIKQADQGWSIYSMMNDAAAAASGRGGVFSPAQLNVQVRKSANRMGSNMAGKGLGPLQDIATAGVEELADDFGNPGTADVLSLMGTGGGIMTGMAFDATQPAALATAGALTTAAAPYVLAARKVIETLPPSASPQQLAQAQQQLAQLAAASNSPQILALQREVAARLSAAAGVAGGAAARPMLPGVTP